MNSEGRSLLYSGTAVVIVGCSADACGKVGFGRTSRNPGLHGTDERNDVISDCLARVAASTCHRCLEDDGERGDEDWRMSPFSNILRSMSATGLLPFHLKTGFAAACMSLTFSPRMIRGRSMVVDFAEFTDDEHRMKRKLLLIPFG